MNEWDQTKELARKRKTCRSSWRGLNHAWPGSFQRLHKHLTILYLGRVMPQVSQYDTSGIECWSWAVADDCHIHGHFIFKSWICWKVCRVILPVSTCTCKQSHLPQVQGIYVINIAGHNHSPWQARYIHKNGRLTYISDHFPIITCMGNKVNMKKRELLVFSNRTIGPSQIQTINWGT